MSANSCKGNQKKVIDLKFQKWILISRNLINHPLSQFTLIVLVLSKMPILKGSYNLENFKVIYFQTKSKKMGFLVNLHFHNNLRLFFVRVGRRKNGNRDHQ